MSSSFGRTVKTCVTARNRLNKTGVAPGVGVLLSWPAGQLRLVSEPAQQLFVG
jgi:hypothetical protein